MPSRRPAGVLTVALGVLALAATACSGGDDTAATDDPTPTTVTTATTVTVAPDDDGGDGAVAGEADHVVEVVVTGGVVDGGAAAVSVRRDEVVRLVVTADVADEVHVHGYDLTVETEPGRPVELTFTADLPGRWEIELEELGLLLVNLTVT